MIPIILCDILRKELTSKFQIDSPAKRLSAPIDEENLGFKLDAKRPSFLMRRSSLVAGIGEILEPLEKRPKFWYVFVKLPFKCPPMG